MIVLIQVFRVVISEQIIVNLEPVKCKRRTTLGKSLLFSRVLYRELWPATYCSRVSRYPHRLPVQHILWSGRRRANCYWTHCMHGGEKCHAIQKSRLGEWFSCVLNQWGALCYYSVDGQAEADIMPRKKPFVPSVSEIKTLCSSAAITAASEEHCCTG